MSVQHCTTAIEKRLFFSIAVLLRLPGNSRKYPESKGRLAVSAFGFALGAKNEAEQNNRETCIDEFSVATSLPAFRGVDFVSPRQRRRCLPERRRQVPVAHTDSPMICIVEIVFRQKFLESLYLPLTTTTHL